MTKICTRCHAEKPLDAYYTQPRGRLGRMSWCIACAVAYRREVRARPEKREREAQARQTPAARNAAAARQRRRRASPEGWFRHYAAVIRCTYGITLLELATLYLAQWFRCAGCKSALGGPMRGRRGADHIDHDHASGRVRGILCRYCNLAVNAHMTPARLQRLALYLSIDRHGVPAEE
jgi:hypothetical protein